MEHPPRSCSTPYLHQRLGLGIRGLPLALQPLMSSPAVVWADAWSRQNDSSIADHIIAAIMQQPQERRQDLTLGVLEHGITTLMAAGEELQQMLSAFKKADLLDEGRLLSSGLKTALNTHDIWVKKYFMRRIREKWGNKWYFAFKQRREPSKSKAWPLRLLLGLSLEEAASWVAQARTSAAHRSRLTGQWRGQDFVDAVALWRMHVPVGAFTRLYTFNVSLIVYCAACLVHSSLLSAACLSCRYNYVQAGPLNLGLRPRPGRSTNINATRRHTHTPGEG